ncbi:iron donor protein CyaY [Kwoniella dendrophila CBS 6074]|uniref:ferroxidase n=1 Tax=Kwoniella dendrophila CBS 6074 TaxID=1295534 RepID=A0AAX4K7C8_9TREE
MSISAARSTRLLKSIHSQQAIINKRIQTTSPLHTISTFSKSSQQHKRLPSSPSASTNINGFRQFASSSSKRQVEQGEKTETTLSPEEYEKISERDMDLLHENLEIYVEQYGPNDWEVEYSSGVMTLKLPPHGTYVINKQPPNLQIWISSPVSGPSRFDFKQNQGGWVHHRNDDIKLGKLLEEELRGLLEKQGNKGGSEEWEGTGL